MQKEPVDILQQERYRVLIDHAPQPMLILDVKSGKFIDFNHKAELFFKLPGAQLQTMGPADLSPELVDGKNTFAYVNSLIQKALNGDSSIFPWVHRNSAGEEIHCEIWMVRFPPFDRQLVSATIIDKTQKLEMERALSVSEERLRLALEVTGLGTFDWSFQDNKLHWDDQMHALHGLSPGTEVDKIKYLFSILHPEDGAWLPNRLESVSQPGIDFTSFDREYRIVLKGQTRHLHINGSFFRDENGQVERVIGTVRDVSKEKEAEKQKLRARQLELKNKELEQFAFVVSHDLQEPLHTLKGFVHLLQHHMQVHLDEQSSEFIERIDQSVDRMYKLIRALLDYSRIGLYEKAREVDCNDLVYASLDDLEAKIKQSDARIHFSKLPKLNGYETELRLLFQNLISNGIKFQRENVPPVIRISARYSEEGWEFCVTDNGIGISPKHQHRIFAIFHRLHPHAHYPGTGIGLSHCQKIVELHGGKIWVEPNPEHGSKFFFTIPD